MDETLHNVNQFNVCLFSLVKVLVSNSCMSNFFYCLLSNSQVPLGVNNWTWNFAVQLIFSTLDIYWRMKKYGAEQIVTAVAYILFEYQSIQSISARVKVLGKSNGRERKMNFEKIRWREGFQEFRWEKISSSLLNHKKYHLHVPRIRQIINYL